MKFIQIGRNRIGKKYKPYIVVEACVNHQGNFEILLRGFLQVNCGRTLVRILNFKR